MYPHPLPSEHTAPTALAGWQIDPQVPQFETLIGVSQPLVLSPSQSRYLGCPRRTCSRRCLARGTATLRDPGTEPFP